MICSNCKTAVNENNMFCPNCGTTADKFISEPETVLQEDEETVANEKNEELKNEAPDDIIAQSSMSPSSADESPVQNTNQIEQPVNQPFWFAPTFPPSFFQPPRDPGRDFAIASLVLGIVSYLLLCAVFFGWPSTFATTITGIVLGSKALKKSKQVGLSNTMAVAGIVTSALALAAVSFICLMYLLLFLIAAEMPTGELFSELI